MALHLRSCFLLIVVVIISFEVQETTGIGFIELEFESYLNEHSSNEDGDCCESATSSCRTYCDSIYTICLQNSSSRSSCNYGTYVSKTVSDDDIRFKDNEFDKNLAAPYKFTFDKWLGNVTLTIRVKMERKDGISIAPFNNKTLPVTPSLYNTSISHPLHFQYGLGRSGTDQKKILKIKYKIECDQDYLLPDCFKKSCTPQSNDDNGHYNCSERGHKICLDGWMNPKSNCTTLNITSSSSALMVSSRISTINSKTISLQVMSSISDIKTTYSSLQCETGSSKISSTQIVASISVHMITTKSIKLSTPEKKIPKTTATTPYIVSERESSNKVLIYTTSGSAVFLAIVIIGSFIIYHSKRKSTIVRPERVEIRPINNKNDAKINGI